MWTTSVLIAISAGKSHLISSGATRQVVTPMFSVNRRHRTKKLCVRRQWQIARLKQSATMVCKQVNFH